MFGSFALTVLISLGPGRYWAGSRKILHDIAGNKVHYVWRPGAARLHLQFIISTFLTPCLVGGCGRSVHVVACNHAAPSNSRQALCTIVYFIFSPRTIYDGQLLSKCCCHTRSARNLDTPAK